MKIIFGCTRIVLVFSQTVIKIPRIRVLYPIRRFFEYRSNKQVGLMLKKFDENTFFAVCNYFLSGFRANRLEYLYSKNTSSVGIVPVRGILFGIILIQQKGEVLTNFDSRWIRIYRIIRKIGIAERDTIRSCNFCIIGNRIQILDYGCQATIAGLNDKNLKILERFGTA